MIPLQVLSPVLPDTAKSLPSDSAEAASTPEAGFSFADILRVPLEIVPRDLLVDTGKALPADGKALPPVVPGSVTADLLQKDVETPITPLTETRLTLDVVESRQSDPALRNPIVKAGPVSAAIDARPAVAPPPADPIAIRPNDDSDTLTVLGRQGDKPPLLTPVQFRELVREDVRVDAPPLRLAELRPVSHSEARVVPQPPSTAEPAAPIKDHSIIYALSSYAKVEATTPNTASRNQRLASVATVDSGVPVATHTGVATTAARQPVPVTTVVEPAIFSPKWADAFNEKVVWMTDRQVPAAEIRLNPPELGPIRVQVNLDDNAARINFSAPSAVAREAIEAALPRLREMLDENGVILGDTNIGDTDARGGDEAQSADSGVAEHRNDAETHDDATADRTTRRVSQSLVDTFA